MVNPKPKIDGYIARGSHSMKIKFNDDEVTQQERLEHASVSWGATENAAIDGLPAHFTYYAVVKVQKVKQKQGIVLDASYPDYPSHCELFGIDKAIAINLFSNVTKRIINNIKVYN